MDLNSKTQLQLKIVLLGNANVGKTSLILNFMSGRFLEQQPNSSGASYSFKLMAIKNEQVKVQIWDTAGQERFSGFTSLYYRDANGCMVVYDVTDPSSLQKSVEIFKTVLQVNPRASFAVIGNKADLQYELSVNQTDVKAAFYQALQDNIDREKIFKRIQFLETSAKLGTNVTQAFEHLAEQSVEAGSVHREKQQDEGCFKKKKGGK
ncbi:Rab1a [Hexamita inflata]|uniref:Rab1a n=1 Tax=Hexamita inflata TaxID=28002 RepID=A0AA86QEE7_9EUKA|nr:Rab1a [Hexamita inflata]CAI9951499.1 Rab1a [Hexamita inflata]